MGNLIKVGFSEIGGIYIGKEIQTEAHIHHAFTVAISFSENFEFVYCQETILSKGLIIYPHTVRTFINKNKVNIAFIHIDAFCSKGLKIFNKEKIFSQLTKNQTDNILNILKHWLASEENNEYFTEQVIDSIIDVIEKTGNYLIDERIEEAINFVRNDENITLTKIAHKVHLSVYRFSHLFRQETGMSFREFVLYSKLIKAIKAIYKNKNLSKASYIGGFADQAHFTRTFYKAFGVLPSRSLK